MDNAINEFKTVDGKKLRRGWTTGSCAAAAAAAAAGMLLSGKSMLKMSVTINAPQGLRITLPVEEARFEGGAALCAVRKDSGDDPDITNGILIFARAEKFDGAGIVVEGGSGVGRVTKAGLDAPLYGAAINSVPLKMIKENAGDVCAAYNFTGGLRITIIVPEGGEIAKRTFNPRLGVVGGISILGTTGIVEPMSEAAYIGTIKTELSVRRAAGDTSVVFTPGNIGREMLKNLANKTEPVICSNFIGDAIDLAAEAGFEKIIVAGHIGKLIKLVTGNFNTHSKYGDGRQVIFAAFAGAAGGGKELISSLLDCAVSDACIELLKESCLWDGVLARIQGEINKRLAERCLRTGKNLSASALLFSREGCIGYYDWTKM